MFKTEQRVYYADTDSYGVVWHGTYLRWMEAARVDFCSEIGINLVDLYNQDIAIPVTNINIRYKSSAKLDDNVIVETSLIQLTPLSAKFKQVIKNSKTNTIHTIGEVDVVAVHNDGKLYRRLPDILKEKLERCLECSD